MGVNRYFAVVVLPLLEGGDDEVREVAVDANVGEGLNNMRPEFFNILISSLV